MKILALETSAKAASVAMTEEGRVLCSAYQATGLTHSRTVMPMVEAMLKNADLTTADIDAIAVAAGPGSFTGIRIGVAAAKGLAFALDKPVCGVSTLEAMAGNVAWWEGIVVCAMDARRQQVYNAVFAAKGGQLTRLAPDRAIGLSELAEELQALSGPILVVGDGAELCQKYLRTHDIPCRLAPPHLVMQNAVSVALAAENGPFLPAQELAPVYLRISQAERERNERLKREKELSK